MTFWDGTRWLPESTQTSKTRRAPAGQFRASLTRPVALLLAALLGVPAAAVLAGTNIIEGSTFQDLNRDGVRQIDEPALADQEIYLLDGRGAFLRKARSDASGNYAFGGLPDGPYEVAYSTESWRALRMEWTPTTTGSIHPRIAVDLTGRATVEFGWREIGRSRDLGSPLSTFVGPNGLRAESFNDVVSARDIYEAVTAGTVGAEAQFITIRFDFSDSANTALSYQRADGMFHTYRAVCYANWLSWLTRGDSGLSHEYGHAWSMYYDTIVQQDGELSGYLRARGLEGDSRIDTSYAWSARELVAEDYRQLLGSSTAQQAAALNPEIPPATEVPGLREFFELVFTVAPLGEAVAPPPSVEPSSSSEATPSPESSPTPEPLPEDDTQPSPDQGLEVAAPSVTPSPVLQSATIRASVNAPATVLIEIRDSEGRLVRTLLSEASVAGGTVEVAWDRRDGSGRRVKGGMYVVVVVAAAAADGEAVQAQTSFRVR